MGSITSNHWAFRLTTDDEIDFKSKFPEAVFGIYVAEEGGETGKRHYHVGLSFKEAVTRNALNRMISAFFEQKGNGYRSLKKWMTGGDLSRDRYIIYLYKSGNEVVRWGTAINLQTPEVYRLMSREITAAVTRQRTFTDKMMDEVFEDFKIQLSGYKSYQISQYREIAVKTYLDWHKANGRRLKGVYLIVNDVNNIIWRLDRPEIDKFYEDRIVRQIARQDIFNEPNV